MLPSRTQRVEKARAFLGIPYRHQGRNPSVGLDCVGLVFAWFAELGFEIPEDRLDYSSYGSSALLKARVGRPLERIPVCAALPGDVVLISARPGGPGVHLAILTDHGILHVSERRKVSEHRLDEAWLGRIDSAWTLKA